MANKQNTFIQKILDRIISGEFKDNIYLPCERDLVNEYGISRVTVRNGLKALVSRHILRPDARKGYIVLHIPEKPVNNERNIGGLWCSGTFNQYTVDLFSAAESVAEERSFHFFLKHTPDDEFQQAAHLAELMEEKTDGLLVVPTYSKKTQLMNVGNHALLTAVYRSGIPLVMVDRDFPETDLPCVVNDEYQGGKTAAEHLAGLGHSNVMLVYSDFPYYVSQRRLSGFTDQCRKQKIKVTVFRIPNFPFPSDPEFHQKRQELLKTVLKTRASAIMINHLWTETILHDLLKSGIAVDFLLYDQSAENFAGEPRVWCVERPIKEISAVAMDLLLDSISRRGKGPCHQIRLRPVVRHCMNAVQKEER